MFNSIRLNQLTCTNWTIPNWMQESEVESRTQRSRPRTQKNARLRPRTALPRADPLEAKGRNAQGQGPRTQAKCSSKKKGLQKHFSGNLQKASSKKLFRQSTKFKQFKR